MRKHITLAGVLGCAIPAVIARCARADSQWFRSPSQGAGDWFNPNNWDAGVPNGTSALILNGGTAQIASGVASVSDLDVNDGACEIFDGSLTAETLYVGSGSSQPIAMLRQGGGTITINSYATFNEGANVSLNGGYFGASTLSIGKGSLSQASGTISVQYLSVFGGFTQQGVCAVAGDASVNGATCNLSGSAFTSGSLGIFDSAFEQSGLCAVEQGVNVTLSNYRLNSGTLSAGSLWVAGSTFFQSGRCSVTADVFVTDGHYTVAGGLLSCANLSIDGEMHLGQGGDGVVHTTTNPLLASDAVLDLADGAMVVSSNFNTTAFQPLKSGYAEGAWNGTGIQSSTAASVANDPNQPHKTGIGYAKAGRVGLQSIRGVTLAPTDWVFVYTLYGDTNLDGVVNALDFNALAAFYGRSGSWEFGDFDYDLHVTSKDFAALAMNFNSQISDGLPYSSLSTSVPEPTLIFSMLISLLGLRRRSRS